MMKKTRKVLTRLSRKNNKKMILKKDMQDVNKFLRRPMKLRLPLTAIENSQAF